MKKIFVLLVICCVPSLGVCQPPKPPHRPPHEKVNANIFPKYDKRTKAKIKGEIVEVRSKPIPGRNSHYIELLVRTEEKGTILVMLGPDWFVEEANMVLRPGEKVKIKGSIVTRNGTTYMIARAVKTNGYKLKLRDSDGFPVWSGWKKN